MLVGNSSVLLITTGAAAGVAKYFNTPGTGIGGFGGLGIPRKFALYSNVK